MARPDRHRSMVLATDAPPIDTSKLRYDYSSIAPEHRQRVMEATVDILAHGKRARQSIIAMGQRLLEVKALLPEGTFTAWLRAEFELSPRMAENWMNVARQYSERPEIISVLSDTVLYLLAAPSTPDEARTEVEQAADAGKRITVEFAKQTIAKHKPPPHPPINIPMLENAIWDWLREMGEDGAPDSMLDALRDQLRRADGRWRAWLIERLEQAGLAYTERDLLAATNNVRAQHLREKRETEARVVYTEPKPEPEPMVVHHTPPDLEAAGYAIQPLPDGLHYRWVNTDGEAGEPSLSWADAVADARVVYTEPSPANLEDAVVEWLGTLHGAFSDPSPLAILDRMIEQGSRPDNEYRRRCIQWFASQGIDSSPDAFWAAVAAVRARLAEEATAPPADPRLALAREGIERITAAQAWVRTHYLELTGIDTQAWMREGSKLIEPLERLVAILEGRRTE